MNDGVADAQPQQRWWRSRLAIAAWVALSIALVASSVWSARAGEGGTTAPPPAGPGASPSASGAGPGTPKITISFAPAWTSAANPIVAEPVRLQAQLDDPAVPVLLATSVGGVARLDPADGSWLWSTPTVQRPWVGWAGSVALFAGHFSLSAFVAGPPTTGVAPDGREAFTTGAGTFVTATGDRVLLAAGRSLTAVGVKGQVVWRATLPAGVTRAGRVAGGATTAVFSSTRGPGRVTVVDLSRGALTTFPLTAQHPTAWVTPTGVLVSDGPEPGALTFFDPSGLRQWSTAGKLHVEDASADHVLVSDPAGSLQVLDLETGATLWAARGDHDPFLGGALTATADGTLVVVATTAGSSGQAVPAVLGVDPVSGEQRWEAKGKAYVGTWHDFVLLSDTDGAVLSAIAVKDGIADATLNVGSTLSTANAAVVGNTLIYLDDKAGTARGLHLTDHP